MKKVWIFLSLTAICIFCFTVRLLQSQDNLDKFRIEVSVNCDDQVTKKLIESYIKRELRSLGDVTVSKALGEIVSINLTELGQSVDYPTHELFLLVSRKNGFISIACSGIEYVFPYQILRSYLSMKQKDEFFHVYGFKSVYKDAKNIVLKTGGIEDLQNHCKDIVATFDTDVLEESRQKK